MRSYEHPRRVPDLTAKEIDSGITGNLFADFVWEVAGLGSQGKAQFLVLEQPEDLEAMQLRCVPALVYPGYLLRRAPTSSAASTEDDAQTAG